MAQHRRVASSGDDTLPLVSHSEQRQERRGLLFSAAGEPTALFKAMCLASLLISTVCGTLLAEGSKVRQPSLYHNGARAGVVCVLLNACVLRVPIRSNTPLTCPALPCPVLVMCFSRTCRWMGATRTTRW